MYRPVVEVTASVRTPLPVFRAVTLTPGNVAPVWSVTVPAIVAVISWAAVGQWRMPGPYK